MAIASVLGRSTPLLHRLTHRGYLSVRHVNLGRTRRRLYRATPKGRRALTAIRHYVRELTNELDEDVQHDRRRVK